MNKRKDESKKEFLKRVSKYRTKRYRDGRCLVCGKPRKKNRVRCEECLEKAREYWKKHHSEKFKLKYHAEKAEKEKQKKEVKK